MAPAVKKNAAKVDAKKAAKLADKDKVRERREGKREKEERCGTWDNESFLFPFVTWASVVFTAVCITLVLTLCAFVLFAIQRRSIALGAGWKRKKKERARAFSPS